MARVAIVNERSVRLRRWQYGVNAFEGYIEEVLQQLRIPFLSYATLDDALNERPDVLIVALCEESSSNGRKLIAYATEGGTVVSYAGLNSLARELGYYEDRPIGAGYMLLSDSEKPLRFLAAKPWSPLVEDRLDHQQSGILLDESPVGINAGSALISIPVGKGCIERWSVDIGSCIVALQQGVGPVVEDGMTSPDGTVPLRDDILKADDECAMDWEYDRKTTDTGVNYFAYPYADWWRDVLIRHLIAVSLAKGKPLPFLHYWPSGIPSVAVISHDSDLNEDAHADTTLKILREVGIQSTWCMLEPGYSSRIYEEAKSDGHEIALHYNALNIEGKTWEEETFRQQSTWLKRAAKINRISSNKNHYTCFEGWGDLYLWCERYGIEADHTRGPSKKGNIGLLFGTCHPFFPISDFSEGNRFYDVLEIGFLSQDLNHPALYDSSVIDPFLDTIQNAEGFAHFLFHQAHIHNYEFVRQALRDVVAGARKRGFALWTIAKVNDWERARRNVWIAAVDEAGCPILEGAQLPEPADVYVPVIDDEILADGVYETRFGVRCRKYTVGGKVAVMQPVSF